MARIEEQSSEREESYRLLLKGEGFRIGLATGPGEAEAPSTTIELLVRLFWTGKRLGPDDMKRASGLVNELDCMGYPIFFQEDGWISCEKPVPEDGAGNEAERIRALLESR